ncbi:MAG: extracellular solute-binding protein, partial [Thermohalobaculum sp.]|nr:extracellular solute-binding protein [Thermohalobaculum sp.]
MRWTRRQFGQFGLGLTAAGLLPAVMPGRMPAAQAAAGTIRAHGVSAFGDLAYPADFPHYAYVNPAAPKGGTMSTGGGPGTFDSLNPFILKGNAAALLGLTLDALMDSAADEPDAVYGLIAESIEYPEDRMWAAFDLRPEARFADGSPVTAEDVAFSFTIRRDKGHPSFRLQYAAVTGVTVEGPHRVRFDFDANAARRDLPMAVAGLPVMSKAWWQGRDFAASSLTPILGSGPYAVDKADPGRVISYVLRDDYWARDLPVNRGRWNFRHISFEYYRDRSASFEGFKAGKFLFNEEFWSKQWATGYDFPALTRGDVVRETLPDNRPSGTQGYWFNLRRAKFADPRVRKAIAICFDFEWSNKTLFFDLYTRTDSFFEGGPMEASGPPTPGEAALLERLGADLPADLPEDVFGPAYVPPTTDGSGRNRRQLREAGALLDAAGWTVVDGKRRNAAGELLEIEFLDSSSAFERITVPFIGNLQRIGISAFNRVIDPAQYRQRMDDYDFDITTDRKVMSLTPGVELRDYFHSSSANSPGSDNTAGVANPAVDRLIDVIERAEDRATLGDAVRALDRVLRAMHIWVPQWSKASHHLAYWDIYARPEVKPAYSLGNFDLWWVDPARFARLQDRIGG